MASDCFWNNVETLSNWTGRGDLAAVERTDEPEEDQLFFVFGWLSVDSITSPKYPPPPEFEELTFCSFIGFTAAEVGTGGCTEAVGGTTAGCNAGTGAGRDMCAGRFWECWPLLSGNSRDERGDGLEVVTDICGMLGCPISRWTILGSS